MIEKLEKHIIGENAPGTVPLMVAPTAEQQVDKINELVDAVNELQMKAEPQKCEPITLIDMFNEMGRLYADLWNKMEDIHHYLKTKGCDNE